MRLPNGYGSVIKLSGNAFTFGEIYEIWKKEHYPSLSKTALSPGIPPTNTALRLLIWTICGRIPMNGTARFCLS